MLDFWHFFVHWTGGDYGANYGQLQPYDWLSGILGLSIIGLLITNYRKYNCEVHGCWRLGRHATAAGHVVCRKHHPHGHLTPEAVVDAHVAALQPEVGVVVSPPVQPSEPS